VTAIAVAGWLFLFVVLLIVPPSPGPLRGGGPDDGRELGPDGDEPPAVISLLAGGPALCVVPAETPGGALADGFEGGEADFMSAFKEEVDAEARRRELTRARLSGRRIGLLCLCCSSRW
jgi:hypothetical protein